MESLDQINPPTLLGNEQIAARVDYRVCEVCGFRLKRVETTIINDQHLVVEHCPICGQPGGESASISKDERSDHFDFWLATHGLDRSTLEQHYHLRADDFFDPVR
jgi:hypothetical protein